MTDLDELIDSLVCAARESTAAYEWGTSSGKDNDDDVAVARSAIVEQVEALSAELRAARTEIQEGTMIKQEHQAAQTLCEAAEEFYYAVAHDLRCQNIDDEEKAWESTFLLRDAMDKLKNAIGEYKKANGVS